jgi:4-hydroxy-2-oxoheptanedioate aldolase
VAASDLAPALRTAATDGAPSVSRGLWLSFLSAYGLEAVLTGAGASILSTERSGATAGSAGDGGGGVGWIGLDLQHGDLDVVDVVPLVRVAERAGMPVLARMASHAGDAIGKVVDAGAQGVIVPGVESASEAAALVRVTRLPPVGGRSTGSSRTALGITDGGEPLLLPMVETAAGLAAAADIAAVDGVDGIFIGPYDLSMSLGCRPGDDQVMTAIASVIDIVRAAGKIIGMFAGRPDLLAVAPRLDLVAVDTDVTALRRGVADLFG